MAFKEMVKEQIVTEKVTEVTKIADEILFTGTNGSMLSGVGTCSIASVGKKQDGTFVTLANNTVINIEDAIGKTFLYTFNGTVKQISVAEVVAIMGSWCEEAWSGNFSKTGATK